MRTKLFAAGLLIALAAGPAYPQRKEILQLQVDMINLSKQMQEVQTSIDRNNSVLKALVERMADQVNGLAGGLQKVTQTVEGVKGESDKTSNEMRTILTTLNTNMNDLQEGLSAVRSQINSISQQVTTIKTTAEPLAGPEDLWRAAQLDNFTGNYDLAISGYREFISKYPNDPHSADAQLAIAEALLTQKKYEQAVTDYDLFLQKYPEGDKSRIALYKKGLALAELNQPQQAILTLQQVVKKYPKTLEADNALKKVAELQRRPR